MTRTLGILLIIATLGFGAARADDPAALQARLAVNRARAALYGFQSGTVARDVDAAARRGSFYEALDDARAHVRALAPGAGRAEAGHALNRVLLDATFTTCLSTEGRGYRHRLITPGEACERLDREAIGAAAPAVESALLAVHGVTTKSYPPRGWARGDVASAKELFRSIVASFDEATAALRALIPGEPRYVDVLAPRLEQAVKKVRRLEVRGGGFAGVGGEVRALHDVGTIIDEAYVAARTPARAPEPVYVRIQAAGLATRARPGDVLTATIGASWSALVRIDVELIDSTGAFRGLRVHRPAAPAGPTTSFRLSLPVPADTTPGAHRLLVSVLGRDGQVNARAFPLDIAPATGATPSSIGLLGAVDRVSDARTKLDVSGVAPSYGPRQELRATVRLVSPDQAIAGWEARIVGAEGGTHALEAARCDGDEAELTTYLRVPAAAGNYRLVVVMKLADGTSRTAARAFVVSRAFTAPAGSP